MATGGRGMTYPDGIDALVNVNANDTLAGGGHAARHNSVNTALVEIKNMLGPSPSGKIIQVVRATDSTQRSTSSTTFVDVTGMSVTITPQKSDSAILILASIFASAQSSTTGDKRGAFQITDSSNNAVSGSESASFGEANYSFSGNAIFDVPLLLLCRSTPAVITAVTYKLRFLANNASTIVYALNNQNTGQMYAIEVSA
jgi:hypothetical protein